MLPGLGLCSLQRDSLRGRSYMSTTPYSVYRLQSTIHKLAEFDCSRSCRLRLVHSSVRQPYDSVEEVIPGKWLVLCWNIYTRDLVHTIKYDTHWQCTRCGVRMVDHYWPSWGSFSNGRCVLTAVTTRWPARPTGPVLSLAENLYSAPCNMQNNVRRSSYQAPGTQYVGWTDFCTRYQHEICARAHDYSHHGQKQGLDIHVPGYRAIFRRAAASERQT